MDNIIEPNDKFDFSNLTLAHPTGIQGGAYFTKIEYNRKPLYIQTCKSQTRQGFVKSGKKYYCDLMFDKNAETLINWFENLEEKCQKLIFERRDTWFQNSLEETDIESAFNSTIRIYKSGKYYLVRTNIRNTHDNNPFIKIYNEHEGILTMADITNETNIISILEIQGIKFTSRNFQIEIELKQVMVLDNEPMFDNCLIKTSKKSVVEEKEKEKDIALENQLKTDDLSLEESLNDQNIFITGDMTLSDLISQSENASNLEELENASIDIMVETEAEKPDNESISLDLDIEDLDLDKDIEENSKELTEVQNNDLNLETTLETIHLKKPNQVYFELYKDARSKAKVAKRNAILAYLEAKNIKKTYMLENLNDSDSDFDAEIDEVSESELEGL